MIYEENVPLYTEMRIKQYRTWKVLAKLFPQRYEIRRLEEYSGFRLGLFYLAGLKWVMIDQQETTFLPDGSLHIR